jgi:hypothetical protein
LSGRRGHVIVRADGAGGVLKTKLFVAASFSVACVLAVALLGAAA